MRESLKNLIEETIIFQYSLPCEEPEICKTHHTHEEDHCFTASDSDSIVPIIYNGIIDYSFNETDIDLSRLDSLHVRALKSKLRYNEEAEHTSKIKYGFFGEILLYLILNAIYGADTLISRGYFYNPLEKSETKGYDTYQLIERDENGKVELWFGEVKFYEDYKEALRKIFANIKKSLSDNYFSQNIIAMSDRGEFNKAGTLLEKIVHLWEVNPLITIAEEVKKHEISFIYPILVAFDSKKKPYDEIIKEVVDYINSAHPRMEFEITIPYKLFFVFLPVTNVGKIKKDVIEWIESKRPLI